MRLLSGDQTGLLLFAELNVNREFVSRARLYSQRSKRPVCGSRRATATELPSGEIAGLFSAPGAPSAPVALPERSNHVSCESPDVPGEL